MLDLDFLKKGVCKDSLGISFKFIRFNYKMKVSFFFVIIEVIFKDVYYVKMVLSVKECLEVVFKVKEEGIVGLI